MQQEWEPLVQAALLAWLAVGTPVSAVATWRMWKYERHEAMAHVAHLRLSKTSLAILLWFTLFVSLLWSAVFWPAYVSDLVKGDGKAGK